MSGKLIISKTPNNVLTETDPSKLVFSSDYGTLKYFVKTQTILQLDASTGAVSAKAILTHNLNKYLFCEVFVRVYIGSPSGNYEYCPFYGSGTSVEYDASVIIKKNTIELFGGINGVSSSVWNFDFLIFTFRNDLDL